MKKELTEKFVKDAFYIWFALAVGGHKDFDNTRFNDVFCRDCKPEFKVNKAILFSFMGFVGALDFIKYYRKNGEKGIKKALKDISFGEEE